MVLRQNLTESQRISIESARVAGYEGIALTQGLVTFVSKEDYVRLLDKLWFASASKQTYYAARKDDDHNLVKMHRLIMSPPPMMEVDHINRNGLDNRRENLRIVTRADNLKNKRQYENNQSGVTGVYYSGAGRGLQKWYAQITKDGVQYHLGRFYTKEDAIHARLVAEESYTNSGTISNYKSCSRK